MKLFRIQDFEFRIYLAVLPIIFSFGPITIYSFGFLLAIGFFLAAFIIWRRLKELGLDEEEVIDLVVLAAILGLLSSKLVFFLVNQNFSGFSSWGGLGGVILTLAWFAKRKKWDFWQIADEVAFGLLPFLVLAQIGVFLDGSTPGRPTNMPWGIYFPGSLLRSQPVSLYSAIAFFLIWLFLLRIERQWRIWSWYKSRNSGLIALSFFGLASLANFGIAFWDNAGIYWYWLEIGLSLGGAILAGLILYYRSSRSLQEDLWVLLKRKGDGKEKIKR